jgi:phage terminase small subunit
MGADTKFAKSPTTKRMKGKRGRPCNAITHAAYSKADLVPLTQKRRREIVRLIRGELNLICNSDKLMVELLARNLAKVELMDRWFDEHGLMDKENEIQPLLKVYWLAVNSSTRMLDQLGLTPASRLRMGISLDNHQDLASQISGAGDNGDNGNHRGDDAQS